MACQRLSADGKMLSCLNCLHPSKPHAFTLWEQGAGTAFPAATHRARPPQPKQAIPPSEEAGHA